MPATVSYNDNNMHVHACSYTWCYHYKFNIKIFIPDFSTYTQNSSMIDKQIVYSFTK